MQERDLSKPVPSSFTIRRLLGLTAAIGLGLAPMLNFGWPGILSSGFLATAGILFVLGSRKTAIMVCVVGLACYLVLPELGSGVRESSRASGCRRNLSRLCFAIHDYHAEHGHIPPPHTTDENGEPLHSWRVLLLPYLGEKDLYDQIDLTKPWDHQVNLQFHDQMPDVFCCPQVRYETNWYTSGNTTAYVVVVGEHTPWHDPPPTLQEISKLDGIESTIGIIESEAHRLPWMSPADPDLTSFLTLPAETWSLVPQYSNYGFAVFQLASGSLKPHPMAFEFETANKSTYFPTLHIHDGEVHARESFDHVLYLQHAGLDSQVYQYQNADVADRATGLVRSKFVANTFCDIDLAQGTVDGNLLVHRQVIRGQKPNQDTEFESSGDPITRSFNFRPLMRYAPWLIPVAAIGWFIARRNRIRKLKEESRSNENDQD